MPRFVPCNRGWIEAITGPMFSGKSEELIRRLVRAKIAGQEVFVFKPSLDDRFSKNKIVSRSGAEIHCFPITSEALDEFYICMVNGIANLFHDVYAFDEAQFFDNDILVKVCNLLAAREKRVIVAGLDTTFKGEPFGAMPHILSIADFVDKVSAVCMKCGDLASKTGRTAKSNNDVLIGDTESYMAMCRKCHNKHLEV